jgi:hypothetical protein
LLASSAISSNIVLLQRGRVLRGRHCYKTIEAQPSCGEDPCRPTPQREKTAHLPA